MAMLGFRELPIEAQKAILCRQVLEMGNDDFEDEFLFDWTTGDHNSKWSELIKQASKVWNNRTFNYEIVSTRILKTFVLENTPDIAGKFSNFDDYHKWYASSNLPDHNDSVWPVLVDTSCGEAFSDGWHRFHSYIKKGIPFIPVINFSNHHFSQP